MSREERYKLEGSLEIARGLVQGDNCSLNLFKLNLQ